MKIIILVAIIIILILTLIILKKQKNTNYYKNKQKGDEYEKKVNDYYKNLGYETIENGKNKGLQDNGIDIIAKKENEILLIQCKNWNTENKYRIREKEVKEFYGACQFFMEEKKINKEITICIYAIPEIKIINNRALQIFKKHIKKCKYQII